MKIAPMILCAFLSLPALAETTVMFNGTGCPQGSGAEYAIDGDHVLLTFPADFTAETYPGSPLSMGRKNCVATIRLDDYSQTYTLETVGFSTYASLPRGGRATSGLSYWFEGQGYTASMDFTKYGPFEDEWTIEDAPVPFYRQIWKPCGADRALNINNRVSITHTPADSSFVQLRTLAVKIKHRNCQHFAY